MNRKGVFFTFMAIFIMILIVAVVTTKDKYRYREKASAIAARVETMNNFISDFEKDADRELYIGGYRALLGMNSYIKESEDYIHDFDSVFREVIVNGSVNGTDIPLMSQGSQGADITSWLGRINEEAAKLNLVVSTEVNDVRVIQESPWSVKIILNLSVRISDIKDIAEWDYEKILTKEFSIIGFEDPLYIVGRSTNLINITPDLDFVDDGDPAVLNNHLLNSYYVSQPAAPSFLMRFAGNLTPSPYGIESMVNLLEVPGSPLRKSVIDYIYFSDNTTTDYCDASGMETWFRIDSSHMAFYEANDLNMTICT